MSLPTTLPAPPLATAAEKPTRVRYGVLGFACVLSMVTYLDRVCFGTVAIFMQREFNLDSVQLGYLFGAFTLAYAVFEIPSGWLGDVYGPRKTLIRIVLWWSFFTALTGAIYPSEQVLTLGAVTLGMPFVTMLVVRFLFGIGEAGAYPNIARAFHNWFPFKERGFAKGTVWMAGRFAGGVTPFIVLALIQESTVGNIGTLSLADPTALTGLLKYDSTRQRHTGVLEIAGGELRSVNGKPIEAGEIEVRVHNHTVVPAEAQIFVGRKTITAGKLELLVQGEKIANGKVEISLNGKTLAAPDATLAVRSEKVFHWRHTFWIFGGMGILWCVLFWAWFRDRPEQKAGVNAAEVALIHAGEPIHGTERIRVPWGKLFGSGNLWLLCGMYFCASYGWYFNITFLPTFLKERFGLQQGLKWTPEWWSFSLMAGLPLLFGSVACLLGGLSTDAFIRRTGNRKWGRRLFGVLGHGICALCYFGAIGVMWLSPATGDKTAYAWLFVLAVALAAFWNDMTMGSAWASCLDVGGRYSGIVAGCMNTVGNLGGFMANILTGWLLGLYTGTMPQGSEAYEQANLSGWTLNFALFGAVYLVAVVLWLNFNANRPIVPEPSTA
jgi:MFS family permease